MKEMTKDEIKMKQIEILDYLHTVCVENDIHYVLAYGTLLGAIRHNGFIPWDDDIDIFIPASEIRKLENAVNSSQKYHFYDCSTNQNYPLSFGKLAALDTKIFEGSYSFKGNEIGVNIDIFYLYEVDKQEISNNRNKLKKNSLIYQLKSLKPNKTDSLVKRMVKQTLHSLMFAFNFNNNANKIRSILIESKGKDIATIDEFEFGFFENNFCLEREVHPFEGNNYFIPKKYDEFLVAQYGDYLIPPPAKDRESTHKNKAYWI